MLALNTTLLFLTLNAVVQPAAPEPITSVLARQAIQRGLTFLKTEGAKGVKANHQCLSCHRNSLLVWSLNEAQRHGLEVDRKEVKQWNDWALNFYLSKEVVYQLNDPSFAVLKKAGVAADKLASLQKAKPTFATPQDLRRELAKVLPAETADQHQAELVKLTVKPKHDGPDIMAATMLLAGAPALAAAPSEATQGLVAKMLQSQQKDGSWKVAGQNLFPYRPGPETVELYTMWNVLALTAVEPLSAPAAQSRDRALAFLKNAKPGVSTESYVVPLLLAHRRGETERVNELLKALLQQQRPDGGWKWVKENEASDALATGEVLYALGTVGRTYADPQVQRAWTFLLKTQQDDGTWQVTNPKGGRVQLWSYWGTGWAVLGMLQTLPR